MSRTALIVVFATALAACSPPDVPGSPQEAQAQPATDMISASVEPSEFGAWGFDLTGRDVSVDPGDDFYRYANGGWMAINEIPADRTRWGPFSELAAEAELDVRAIIEGLPATAEAGTVSQKVRDYYHAYLDVETIERRGLTPAADALAAIAGADSHDVIAQLMGRADLAVESPIGIGVTIDEKNPDRYIVQVGQSGLGLPDREYYLSGEQAFVEIRAAYEAHIARLLELLPAQLRGARAPTEEAQAILALETEIAGHHWPIADRRDRERTYNLRDRDGLEALAAEFPWAMLLTAAGLNEQREFVVAELDAVEALGQQFRDVPIETWQSYLRYHYLVGVADVLPSAFDEEVFDFYGRTLNGQPEQRERWKRAVTAVNRALGEAVGQLYVERHFPPESKAQMTELVENLRRAYRARIDALPWMSEETKQTALEKLATFRPKIGYPDKWRDYGALEADPADAFGNAVRARLFEWNRDLERLSQPTDRDEWFMSPQTVNAYYNPTWNEIVFPAAILQPPFFNPNADPAVNYGAIGGVIGHEMGHGFDDQGAKSDARGVLRTWWRPEDQAAFEQLGDALAEQYGRYEPLPGLRINGRLTLGENIGDLGGLTVAHEAYLLSLDDATAPVLDGLSGEQRFFLGWAQVWRFLQREASLRNQVMSDPHSPPEYRVNGVVRNMDAWYAAFDVQPHNALYLSPQERVRIW